MALMAVFRKVSEDERHVRYQYGPGADRMTSELVLDKATLEVPAEADVPGAVGLQAAGKIIQLYRRRGAWPEHGGSYS